MTKRMLIDATHDEETRVAVVDDKNNRLLEFDYENTHRKPLKGSIFLAKVTRVEPSLQAAFVNFGGNRHGFLPFSEIHPDYFRIPVSDLEALKDEQEAMIAEEEERLEKEDSADSDNDQTKATAEGDIEEVEDDDEVEELNGEGIEDAGDDEKSEDEKPKHGRGRKKAPPKQKDNVKQSDDDNIGNRKADDEDEDDDSNDNIGNRKPDDNDDEDDNRGNRGRGGRGGRGRNNNNNNNNRGRRGGRNGGGRGRHKNAAHSSRRVEVLGGTEYEDEGGNGSDRFRFSLRHKYKIQEVIKRGQIMLVQASREERGNKGAAVTTYLSLPGRYGVLMPNSPRAGGVSRKIAKYEDRQRMRKILKELEVEKNMSVILRTAGVTRTKTEIKRDIDYLKRLWNDIKTLTYESSAPSLIYEEADLIKRAIRDLYTRDVEEIQVSGDEGFNTAKKFMKMMIPSHVKKVKDYKDDKIPLFHKYKVESQISEMSETTAKLKSGGYLVINPTEALVSIDVNSGRATKERHIEETALNTNMEAAEEVARQLRLRDLGGLVVIDFIDMEDRRNNGKVERKLKESLSSDRARIQIGRISSFGLLEMSRQRLNPSLTEAQFDVCTQCEGRGVTRNCDSTSILLLRGLEEEGIKNRAAQLIVHVSNEVALYILNNKRAHLEETEKRYGFSILIRSDDELGVDKFRIEVSKPAEGYNPNDNDNNDSDDNDDESGNNKGRRRGRRGGRGRNNNRNNNRQEQDNNNDDQNDQSNKKDNSSDNEDKKSDDKPKRGRGRQKQEEDSSDDKKDDKPKPTTRGRKKKDDDESSSDDKKKPASKSKKSDESKGDDKLEEKPKATRGRKKKSDDESSSKDDVKKSKAKASNDTKPEEKPKEPQPVNTAVEENQVVNEAPKTKKKGWWSK